MTIHPLEFRSDIRVSYTLDKDELSAFHITLRPIILELIAVPNAMYRWSLLHQLRDALSKLYCHERHSDHGWHHGDTTDRRANLERERWTSLEELDSLLGHDTPAEVDESDLFLLLATLGQSEKRKMALGRPADSISSRHFS
jgi:hypothetical protein